jgi:mono/diheme cytochrome c family protein
MTKLNSNSFVLIVILLLSNITLFGQVTQQTVDAYKKKLDIPAWADTLKNPYANNTTVTDTARIAYLKICSVCHGKAGKGDGIGASGLQVRPANHTSDLVQMQKDGDLFYIITNGHKPMPNYNVILTDKERWGMVNFIRSLRPSDSAARK